MPEPSLTDWLSDLPEGALAELLDRRPDVLLGRPPATLGQLADRLTHPGSLVAVLGGLPLPGLQVLEALQALGERRTRGALGELLDGGGGRHEAAVDEVLDLLSAAGLVWPGPGDRLVVPSGLAEVLPRPLGLGAPLRALWGQANADEIGRALRALGGRPAGRKAEVLAALVARLADPEVVRTVAGRAPAAVAEGLRRLTWEGTDDDEYVLDRFDPELYRQRLETLRWGREHGLLVGDPWGYEVRVPAEVALVLRGPDHRAPFTPHPPTVVTREVSPQVVESAAAAAAARFLTEALGVLDRLARTPVPRLAGGGVGVREIGRLVRELGVGETEVRLVLELASAGGLLEPGADGLGVGEAFAAWRRTEPADQLASLLVAWEAFPTVPSEARDADGKALPSLRGREPCSGCRAGRTALLVAAAALPPGTAAVSVGEVAAAARWARPLAHVLPQDADAPLRTTWREAELFGVLAADALTPVGAAVLAGDLGAAHDVLRRLLPGTTDEAVFGSDLTVLVAGTPSARVTALLDSCADRESSGGATLWRIGPAGVRRALDDGVSADDLLEQLAAISVRELPQPLTYLVHDVARRHGRLRLLPAVSLVRSDDEALLAEVAADRRLARLGLQRVAPTVLSCAVPLDAALARLREVGYFPLADAGPQGPEEPAGRRSRGRTAARVVRDDGPRRRRPDRAPASEPPGPRDLARQLLTGGVPDPPAPDSGMARELARSAPQLSRAELDQLTHAVEEGGRVRIRYRSGSGAVTRRVIADPSLEAGMVYAWCELRQDERVFTPGRILSVTAVE